VLLLLPPPLLLLLLLLLFSLPSTITLHQVDTLAPSLSAIPFPSSLPPPLGRPPAPPPLAASLPPRPLLPSLPPLPSVLISMIYQYY